jgi:hypothetical protein
VDAKLTPVNGRAQMVKFGNHGKHIILMWQFKSYLYDNGPIVGFIL